MIERKAVQCGSGLESSFLLQTVTDRSQENLGGVVLGTQEKDRKVTSDLFQAGADGNLFIAGEGGTYDGEMIFAHQYSSDSLIYRQENIGGVASLGQHVGTRTQSGYIPADSEYSVELRIVGASNHHLIKTAQELKGYAINPGPELRGQTESGRIRWRRTRLPIFLRVLDSIVDILC